jgi:hypothetical protein
MPSNWLRRRGGLAAANPPEVVSILVTFGNSRRGISSMREGFALQ